MNKILFLSAAVILVSASAAQANDFNGFRVEVQTGLDVASAKVSRVSQSTLDGVPRTNSHSSVTQRTNDTSFLYGIGAGYDAEISTNIVAGIEGSINFSTANFGIQTISNGSAAHSRDDDDNHFLRSDYYDVNNAKAKREIEVGARLGYMVSPSTLIYVKGGYVNGRFKLSGVESVGTDKGGVYPDHSPYSYSTNLDGYRVGAGLETLVGGNAFAKLEYRYTNFKNFTGRYTHNDTYYPIGDQGYNEISNAGLSRHQLAAGLGIRF